MYTLTIKSLADCPYTKRCLCSSPVKAVRDIGKESYCWGGVGGSHLEFSQRHEGNSEVNWKKVLCCQEQKIELFGHQTQTLAIAQHPMSARKRHLHGDAQQ